MSAFSSVTVGVADLDAALGLWTDTFGLQVVAGRDGPDAGLARLWGVSAGRIARQALVATPGKRRGMLHLVQFGDPAPPVRAGARVYDLCPKNLDVYVRDMPTQFAALRAAGRAFRNDAYSDVTAPDGTRFREIHMPAHDEINVVLLEVVGRPLSFSAKGYAGVGPLISIVPDTDRERAFLREVMGLAVLNDNVLGGPQIEKMIGLPRGATLHVSIWGDPHEPLGQLEIVEYRGVAGADLYARARPPALGVLHVSYAVRGLDALRAHLGAASVPFEEHGSLETLVVAGPTISFRSPAGLRIEATEPADHAR